MPLNWASKLLSCLFDLNVTSFICLKNKSSINSLLNSILYHLCFFFCFLYTRRGWDSHPKRKFPFRDLNPEVLSDRKVSISRITGLSYRGIKFKYQRIILPLEGFNFLDCRLSYRFFVFFNSPRLNFHFFHESACHY